MKKKTIKNEKLVLRKSTITRLNSIELSQVMGGWWTMPTVSSTCGSFQATTGSSQNSNGGSCFTCGPDLECQLSHEC
jgi:hypothetical protein